MLRRTYDGQYCSVAWTLEVIGERWSLLIVRDALLGVRRFGDFRRRLGIAASVLATRLDALEKAGILQSSPYQDRPKRYEYYLTPRGRDLVTVILSLMWWGDRHLAGESGPPRVAYHSACGGEVEPCIVCTSCATPVPLTDFETRPRPRADHPA